MYRFQVDTTELLDNLSCSVLAQLGLLILYLRKSEMMVGWSKTPVADETNNDCCSTHNHR